MDKADKEWYETRMKKFMSGKPPLWTRVLWEADSPHGPYHPKVLKEGVVLDPKYLPYEQRIQVEHSSLTAIKMDDGKIELIYASYLIY